MNADRSDRLVRIDRMIEYYRRANERRLQLRAIASWRKLEARQALIALEKPLARIH
jgi:hypothetical protein